MGKKRKTDFKGHVLHDSSPTKSAKWWNYADREQRSDFQGLGRKGTGDRRGVAWGIFVNNTVVSWSWWWWHALMSSWKFLELNTLVHTRAHIGIHVCKTSWLWMGSMDFTNIHSLVLICFVFISCYVAKIWGWPHIWDPPASSSRVLGLQMLTTTSSHFLVLIFTVV